MKTTKREIICVILSLILGVGLGAWIGGKGILANSPKDDLPEAPLAPHKPHAKLQDRANGSLEATLRQRIRALEKALAKANGQFAAATNHPISPKRNFGPRSPEEHRAEMERLKKEDPARYAAHTNRMAQFRTHMKLRAANRLDFLSSIDTSTWTKQEQKNHEKLQDLLQKRDQMMDLMRPDSTTLAEEDRATAFQTMHELGREIRQLEEKERTTLLKQTVNVLGYSGDDATEIIDTVKQIYESTQSGPRGPSGPPPPQFTPKP